MGHRMGNPAMTASLWGLVGTHRDHVSIVYLEEQSS